MQSEFFGTWCSDLLLPWSGSGFKRSRFMQCLGSGCITLLKRAGTVGLLYVLHPNNHFDVANCIARRVVLRDSSLFFSAPILLVHSWQKQC
jgi:hypothetical protein